MREVQGGTQKITHRREDPREYESRRRSAEQQAQPNAFINGVAAVYDRGAGESIRASRNSNYGNVNETVGDVLQGKDSNFGQSDNPGNVAPEDAPNQTGIANAEYSATADPEADHDKAAETRLSKRMKLLAGTMGEPIDTGVNDRSAIYGV